ncbi:MAG: ATP-binding protein [Candidatus Brocadia sinica]|nr:ATP-binding protein [Candidatus Brocadia sinica]NUO06673.1 ATP-binding protein [Candidatus Brocadia sinica]
MMELRNIDTSFESYQRIIDLYRAHKDGIFEVIELSLNQWFAANMCSALGGVLDKITENLNEIKFVNISEKIKIILMKNDFLSHYGFKKIIDINNTTIKFLKLKPTDGKYFYLFVTNELLSRPELPCISLPLKKKMTEAIYEIFVNAQIHSETKNIYTCGQFYPQKNIIEFTITDTGIGFKNRINQRFKRNLTSIQTIQWAINDCHTTKIGISGGLGLALLKEFIGKNKGKLQIISDDGFYQYDSNGEDVKLFHGAFPGTIVNLQFKTDDTSSYILSDEVSLDDIF